MSDGRKNNGGKREGAGNPGHGKLAFIRKMVDKYAPVFWVELEKMMTGKEKADKRFAMSEFNKIQVKMIPQDVNANINTIGKLIDELHGINSSSKETSS